MTSPTESQCREVLETLLERLVEGLASWWVRHRSNALDSETIGAFSAEVTPALAELIRLSALDHTVDRDELELRAVALGIEAAKEVFRSTYPASPPN